MRAVLTFIVVAAIVYVIAVLAGVTLAERFGLSNFEGQADMMIAFVYAPGVAIVASTIITLWRVRGSNSRRAPEDRTSGGLRVTLAGVVLGYGAGALIRWLMFEGRAFEQYWQAWIVSALPYIGAIALGLLAFLLSGTRKAED
jgi:hypothetical protein